jgi:hypothetical protein
MEKNIKNRLNALLKFFTDSAPEKFESIKVKDSDVEVTISELKVGADVSVSSSTGSIPAPDATYSLVDGSEFITKDGKISEVVKDADEAVVDVPKEEEKLADEPVAEPAKEDVKSEDKALEDRVAKLEDAMKTILEALQIQPSADAVNEFNKKAKYIDKQIELLSKVQTQLSADSRAEMKDSEMDKLSRLSEKYKNY